MARVFITGSADGLGRMAAQQLVAEGHDVVLHARNPERGRDALGAVRGAIGVVVGDLSTIAACRSVAAQANERCVFDAVIHNAAIGYREPTRVETEDGLPQVFAVNTLAPYILTALMHRPKRLIYLSSGLHRDGDGSLRDLEWRTRPWSGSQAYADSKLHDAILASAVSRLWPSVLSNALEPGWVPTKMGGVGAPDDLALGAKTQAWLAVSNDPSARVTGQYFYHQRPQPCAMSVQDHDTQARLLAKCGRISGVTLARSGRV
jgi:NAD(P)-dependent dehydrogenase (short-subunit alcohol dehydrogenase family)